MHKTVKNSVAVIWCLGLLVAVYLMVQLSLPYTALQKNVDFLITKQRVYHISYWRISFYIHVFTSVLVLPAGFSQFSYTLLHRHATWHRRLGMLYVIVVLCLAAPTGLLMGIHANGGWPAHTSFILLSVCWFLFTLQALVQAKQRKFEAHANWMLCSYALTLSAITLRTYAWLFDVWNIHMRPREVYILIAWASWVPNLLIALLLIKTGFNKRLLLKPGTLLPLQ
jgi:hypothetical protein